MGPIQRDAFSICILEHKAIRFKFAVLFEDAGPVFLAAVYAREAAKIHPIYAQLAAGTVKSPYNWALSDWFNPPVIHGIERKGKLIRVEASDNVMVAKVRVTILDAEGKVLEQGQAVQVGPSTRFRQSGWPSASSGWWEYVSSKEGQVVTEAWGLAGNGVRVEG